MSAVEREVRKVHSRPRIICLDDDLRPLRVFYGGPASERVPATHRRDTGHQTPLRNTEILCENCFASQQFAKHIEMY
jgi:hypothetical protein